MANSAEDHYRLWSLASKNCLVLTLNDKGDVESVKCEEKVPTDDDLKKLSKLQFLMLMNLFLSLVVLQRTS